MVVANNYRIGRIVTDLIKNQIERLDCLETLQPVIVIDSSASTSVITKSSPQAGTSVTAGTGISFHTVTAGKTFYLKGLHIGDMTNSGWSICDATATGGTPKLAGHNVNKPTVSDSNYIAAFTNGIWFDMGTSGTVTYTIWGIEKDTGA